MRELLLGGRAIDQPTLIRFYVMHVIVLPGALGALFVYHMWRVRKDGGLARADRAGRLPAPVAGGAGGDQDLHAARRGARNVSRGHHDVVSWTKRPP